MNLRPRSSCRAFAWPTGCSVTRALTAAIGGSWADLWDFRRVRAAQIETRTCVCVWLDGPPSSPVVELRRPATLVCAPERRSMRVSCAAFLVGNSAWHSSPTGFSTTYRKPRSSSATPSGQLSPLATVLVLPLCSDTRTTSPAPRAPGTRVRESSQHAASASQTVQITIIGAELKRNSDSAGSPLSDATQRKQRPTG